MPKVTFRQLGQVDQTVEIDGVDVSPAVAGFSLLVSAGHLPVVALDLAVTEVETDTEVTRVYVAPRCHNLLTQLGWTPPAEENP